MALTSRVPRPAITALPLRSLLLVLSCAVFGCLSLALTGCSGTTVKAAPDFSLVASPSTLALTAGATGQTVSATMTAGSGFASTVAVALTGLPTGVTASPATFTLTSGAPQAITFTAAANAAAATTTVTLTATSGQLTHTATVSVAVNAAAASPDFSLAVAPSSLALVAGAAGQSVSATVTAINSFSSPVATTITGLPTGVTASPASLTLTPGTAQAIKFTAAANAVASTSTVTLTGTSGSLSHTATFKLTVAAAGPASDFSLAVAPATLALTAGVAGQPVSATVSAINGFTSSVATTITGLPGGVTANPASFNLTPGTPQTINFTAAASAAASTSTVTLTGTSGSLSHTATFKLTVAAAAPTADFSLAVAPTSLSLTAGAAGQQTAVSVTAVNSFSGTVNLTLSALPTAVTASPTTLALVAGTPQSITFTAAANAAMGTSTITLTGTSGSLSHTATLSLTVAATAGTNVTTYHDDNQRTGLNSAETILTPANVAPATFGKLNLLTLDGVVDAEPLYLSGVTINGQTHNVLYAVTEHDSIYALDADNGTQLWKVSALGASETTSDTHNCNQISPEIGITSTPVIDPHQGAHGTIFLVAMSKDSSGAYHQRLHALDLTTGAELSGSPTEITGSYPGTGSSSTNGTVPFLPGDYAERAALLLSNQTIYLGWTSHCDNPPYTGWVMGYNEASLKQTQILNLTPNGAEGSIWMSGAGLAADTAGNIFFLDANGTLDAKDTITGFPVNGDFGNAMIKLSTANNSLSVDDFFEPYNSITESASDIDLGSGGALLLPDLTDAGGAVHHLIVGAGKDSNIYIGNRDNLGKYSSANNAALYQEIPGALPDGAWSMPAYFNNTVYYGGVNDNLKAFTITDALLGTTPSSKSAPIFYYPGATPSVSANGTTNGIVWAVQSSPGNPSVLYAFDATDLTHELYNSNLAGANRDGFGSGNKFITPMIVNGKVYVGTPTGVAIFGLLP